MNRSPDAFRVPISALLNGSQQQQISSAASRLSRSTTPSGGTTYTDDGLGKLAQVSRAGMSAAYLYGPGGMRESKSVTSAGETTTTKSVWSGMTLVAELDSDGTRYEYIYGSGVPLELVVTDSTGASERFGYQVDAEGSVIGITDEAGTVIANYAYDPYGVPTATSGTDPVATRNPLRYRGYYYDNQTGLYYLPARYYEPRSARFLSVDPAAPEAGDPVSFNRYCYTPGDPVNYEDPDGRKWIIGQEPSATDTVTYSLYLAAQRNPTPANVAANRAAQAAVSTARSAAEVAAAANAAYLAAGRAGATVSGAAIPGRFSTIVNVNGQSGMREMGDAFASIPTVSFALVGYGAVHGVLALGCLIAATGAAAATTVTVPFTGGLSLAGGVPIAGGLYASAAVNASVSLGLVLSGVAAAKQGL